MYHPPQKVARLAVRSQQDEFARLLQVLVPEAGRRVEVLALYVMVCVFWALVVYTALAFALS